MRLVRDNVPYGTPTEDNLTGTYLAELNHLQGELVEAIIQDGRHVQMAINIVDMIALLRAFANKLGISEVELTDLAISRNVDLGDYDNKIAVK